MIKVLFMLPAQVCSRRTTHALIIMAIPLILLTIIITDERGHDACQTKSPATNC
jgi:hypothetical protein